MKIELWYDAVAQETDILINGVPVEKNDVYGFLYPVRNYPIQSWLFPNGSWKGIAYQIIDLARDEAVNLVFHGRRCDFDDVCRCLAEQKTIAVTFIEWDVCTRYNELFSKLLSTLMDHDSTIQKLLSSLEIRPDYKTDFSLCQQGANWVCHIREESDLAKAADDRTVRCCIVHNSFLISYDKLYDLLGLTRSLRLPADAIFCCFDKEETKTEYAYYAHSFKRMGFHFCLENDDYAKKAEAKYGLPAIVKLKIEICGELSKQLSSAYSKIKEDTQAEFHSLSKNIVSLTTLEKQRFRSLKLLRDDLYRLSYGMQRICESIDTLFSISKKNKDAVFHYECIDKLDENINLYLNTPSIGEVI